MLIKKTRNKIKCLLGLLVIVNVSGCDSNTNSSDTISKPSQVSKPTSEMKVVKNINEAKQHMILKGQILHQQMEGGFYGFIAENGDKYMPTGLQKKFRKNGLIVELKVELMPDTITTQQFGEVIKILEIKVLDSSKVSTPDKSL